MRSQVRSKRERSRVRTGKSRIPAPSDGVSAAGVDSKEPLFFTFSAGGVDEGFLLHPTHLWVRRIEDGRWRLGIDNLLAYVLPAAVEVRLQGPATNVLKNRLLGKVQTEAGTIPLAAPLSGRLIETNPQLSERPELVQEDPYGEGWLVMMESVQDESDLSSYSAGASSRKFLEEEAQHLRFLLKHRGIELDNMGDTLPDGGAHVRYLHQVLPGPVCLRLANELIMSGKQSW
jgi:glycine cleavage system H protein